MHRKFGQGITVCSCAILLTVTVVVSEGCGCLLPSTNDCYVTLCGGIVVYHNLNLFDYYHWW